MATRRYTKTSVLAIGTVTTAISALLLSGTTGASVAAERSSNNKPPITDVREQGLIDAMQKIDPLLAQDPGLGAGTSWSTETQTLTLRVTDPRSALVDQIGQLPLTIHVKIVSAPYSTATLEAAIDRLFATRDNWARGLPAWGYAAVSEDSGSVKIGVEQSRLADWQKAVETIDVGVPIKLVPETKTGEVLETRLSDNDPWTGGLRIDGNYYSGVHVGFTNHCTSGFNWRRWSNSASAASTANHCINYVDSSGTTIFKPWYNGGVQMGTPVVTSAAADAALLQRSGDDYAPYVYVGAYNSGDSRDVVAAASSDTVGEQVALSGSYSGGPISTVLATGVTDQNGVWITVMSGDVSASGDSGGPWLKTYTNGNVLAKGQHVGKLLYQGAYRSIYSPVIKISAKVEASIRLAP